MKTHLISITSLAAITVFCVGILLSSPPPSEADSHLWYFENTWSSWGGMTVYRSEYYGPSWRCLDEGHAEYSFEMKDYNSLTDISGSDLNGIWVQPFAWTGTDYVYPEGGWWGDGWYDLGAGEYPYICADTDWWVGADVEGYESYKGSVALTIRPTSTQMRQDEVGGHFAFGIYLQKRDEQDTVTPIYPHLEVITSDPQYVMQLNSFPALHDANEVIEGSYAVHSWTTSNTFWNIQLSTITGGLGQYTFPSLNLSSDGYYTWIADFTLDGVNDLGVASYTDVPYTRYIDYWANFILDREAPISNVTIMEDDSEIDLIGDTQTITIENFVHDGVSGLSQTTLYIENVDSGEPPAETVITWPLINDDYIGPRDPLTVSTDVTLDRYTNYRIYAVTEDVAGNIRTSESIYVNAVISLSFLANPNSIATGGDSTLEWTVTGADECIDDGWHESTPDEEKGETHTYPLTNITSDETYSLTCSNGSDSRTEQAVVTIADPEPVMTLTASHRLVRPGDTTTLSWDVSPATDVSNCTLTGLDEGGSRDVDTSGSAVSLPINSTRTHTLTCDHNGTEIEESITVGITFTSFES